MVKIILVPFHFISIQVPFFTFTNIPVRCVRSLVIALFSVGTLNLTATPLLTRKPFLPEGGVSDSPLSLHLAAHI